MSKEPITKGILQYDEKEEMYSVLYGKNGYAVLLDHPSLTEIRLDETEDWQNVSGVLLSNWIGKTVEIRCLYGNERYEFDRNKAYKLVAITDHDGRDKSHTHYFYEERLNCIATYLEYRSKPSHGEYYQMRMVCVQDENGTWICRPLRTSTVWKVEETEKGINIHTSNTIYVLEETTLKEPVYQDEANLIELYLGMEEQHNFAKGFYYNEEKKTEELYDDMHVGTFTDTILIGTYKDSIWGEYVCRYYYRDTDIEFYDTLYGQQDYSTPMLIHNVGKTDLRICFERYDRHWTIKPGESKRIIPYQPDGADLEESFDCRKQLFGR